MSIGFAFSLGFTAGIAAYKLITWLLERWLK